MIYKITTKKLFTIIALQIVVTLLMTSTHAESTIFTKGEGCHVESYEDSYKLFFPETSNVSSDTISRTDTRLLGGYGSSEGILICNATTKPTVPYSCPNTGVEPENGTNYRMLMDSVNDTYCAYQYRVDNTASIVRSDVKNIKLDGKDEDVLPGSFPKTGLFKGPYKRFTTIDDFVGDWHLMTNGRVRKISIKNNNGQLFIDGHGMGDISNVAWTKNGILTFTRKLSRTNLEQNFTGYFMQYSYTDRNGGMPDYKRRIAGTYTQVSPILRARNTSGWYATQPAR